MDTRRAPATQQVHWPTRRQRPARGSPRTLTCASLFCFLVFVQADIQWIALLVDTVTEMLAGVRAATVLAPVCTFNFENCRAECRTESD